jgi:hypothetical protein
MSQRIIVCMPMRDKMTEETARALRDNMDGFDVTLLHEIGKPVREARNALVRRVSEMSRPSDTPVLWADDDAWWPVGTIEKLVGSLDSTPNASVIYGMATHRRLPFAQPTTRRADGRLWDLPLRDDGLVPVLMGSTHCMVHRASLLETWDEQLVAKGFPHHVDLFTLHPAILDAAISPMDRAKAIQRASPSLRGYFERFADVFTDDSSFVQNILGAGGTAFADSGAIFAHVDRTTGAASVPGAHMLEIRDNTLFPFKGPRPKPEDGDPRKYGLPPIIAVPKAVLLQDPGIPANVRAELEAPSSSAYVILSWAGPAPSDTSSSGKVNEKSHAKKRRLKRREERRVRARQRR